MRYLLLIGMVCIKMLNAAGGGAADLANSKMYGATVKKYQAEQKRKSDAQQKSKALTALQSEVADRIRAQPEFFAAVLIKDGDGLDFVHAVRARYEVKLLSYTKKQGCLACCDKPSIVHAEKMCPDGKAEILGDGVEESDKDFIFYGDSNKKTVFVAPSGRCDQLARECTGEQISYIQVMHKLHDQQMFSLKNKKEMIVSEDLQAELKTVGTGVITLTKEQRALHAALPEEVRKLLEARIRIDAVAKERTASVDVAIHSPYNVARFFIRNG